MTSRPRFDLHLTADTGSSHIAFLRRQLRRAHGILKPPLREFSVALVGDRRMSELHERFMNVTGPTDVLTFPLEVDARDRVLSGEVIVCVPEARRAANKHGTELRHELLLYAIHGMLHLAGFDDRTASGFQKMHAAEDRILTRLGIGRVFAARPAPTKRRLQRRRPRAASGVR